MLKFLLFAGILLCLIAPAQARHHHYYHHHHHHHYHHQAIAQPACNDLFCWLGTTQAAVSHPSHYIAGRLACALNVGAFLAERGIRGTGSAAALSYLHWGRSAGGPVPGAVIVSSRRGGGHVAIVSRVEHGTVYAWNSSGGWREIAYHRPVLDYRIP